MSDKSLKITILPGNTCHVQGTVPKTIIDESISFRKKGFQFSPAFKKGIWDGKIHLFNDRRYTFATGLIDIVCEASEKWAKRYGHSLDIEIIDEEEFPEPRGSNYEIIGVTPRDYQLEAAERMLERGRGIVKAATNAGKTAIAAMVLKKVSLPSIVLVPSKDLLHQTSNDLKNFLGKPVGRIGGGEFQIRDVTVAMPQTLIRRLTKEKKHKERFVHEYLASIQLVIADECHTLGAKTFEDVMKAILAPYRFGMSGTPLNRSDGADLRLIAQTGEVIFEISNAELMKSGVSLNAKIEFHTIKEPQIKKDLTYAEVYDKGVVNNFQRNELIVNTVLERAQAGLQSLIVVKRIEHGENLETMFPRDFSCKFVNGSCSMQERKKALKDFRAKKLNAIIATKIFDMGISVNNIDVLVMAASGKSQIETLQRLGRGIRTGGNSDILTVVEFADLTHKYLRKHAEERFKTYQSEKCLSFKLIQ